MVDRYSNSRRESKISHTHYSHSSASHFGGSSNSCPSFSSMLLDEIYRSIDPAAEEEKAGAYGGEHTARKKIRDGHHHANVRPALFTSGGEIIMADYYRRASCIVEKKKSRKVRHGSSSTSSWDSSCGGGGFSSSSEAESFRSKKFGEIIINHTDSEISPGGDSRRGFGDRSEQKSKTKLRELKIYGDLKKMKQQPISPGRKLAGFLNSIFTAGNLKKKVNGTAIRGGGDSPAPKSTKPSTGLGSKTPPSRGKYSAGARRAVSLIADEEDSRGAPENYDEVNIMKTAIDEEVVMQVHVMKKNRRVGEAARDFVMNIYQKKKEIMGCDQFVDHQYSHSSDHLRKTQDFDEEEEFDAESYESSDLFELDNLSAIGIMQEMRYREELPVYETTHLHTNRVITN